MTVKRHIVQSHGFLLLNLIGINVLDNAFTLRCSDFRPHHLLPPPPKTQIVI